MKKGYYIIATDEGLRPELGSFERYGELMVNRADGYRWWRVTHITSGRAIKVDLALKKARQLVKELEGFQCWQGNSQEELMELMEIHKEKENILKIINE